MKVLNINDANFDIDALKNKRYTQGFDSDKLSFIFVYYLLSENISNIKHSKLSNKSEI